LKQPKLLLLSGVMAGLLAVVLLLGGADTAHASFNPTLSVTLANTEAGASSGFTVDFVVPDGDVNFGAAVFFIPPEWGIASSDDVPIGTVVGQVYADTHLGLANAACASPVPALFTMVNSSIDISDTVSYLDSDAQGETGWGIEDVFEDKDGSGLQDGIERYPDFLTRLLADENDQPLQPISRAAGITKVSGVNVLLEFVLFDPGTFIDEKVPNDPELGTPSVTVLQNYGDPGADPVPSAITDFCSELSSEITIYGISMDNACTDAGAEVLPSVCDAYSAEIAEEGGTDPDESGIPLFTNPSEGTYTFTLIAAGQPDADGDGIENDLDTCKFEPNVGNPRIQGDGDADFDGLDAICDPNDDPVAGGTNADEDLDDYQNRQDNCPLVPNGEEGDNQRDTDDDFIGDACDTHPEDADPEGETPIVKMTEDVTIGPGGPPTQETPTAEVTPSADHEESDGGGLGAGAIIGIVIGVIAAVVVLGGGAFYFMRRGGA
jgi:hypothetical protein